MRGLSRRSAGLAFALAAILGVPAALASAYSDFNAGVSANENSRCDKAVAYMTSALTQPGLLENLKPLAYLVRGECEEDANKHDLALADFSAAIALNPQSFDAYFLRARLHVRRNEIDAALADYAATIRIRPDLPRGYQGMAYAHMRARRYDEAIADFSAAIKLNVDVDASRIFRSNVYMLKGDFDNAMDDADALVSMDRNWPRGYVERGRIYSHQTRFSRAENAFNDALRIDPANGAALLGKGLAQWSQDEFKDAAATLAALSPHVPSDGYVALWLTITRFDAGVADPDLAKRVETVDPKAWPAPLLDLYLGKTTPEAVSRAALAADEVDRDDQICEAQFYTAEWQLQHKAPDAALALFTQAAQDCPKSNVEWDAAGVVLKRLGKK